MFVQKRPWPVIALLILGFLFLMVYWIMFYTLGAVQVSTDESYLTFQRSFILADSWLAGCCLIGAMGLWLRREWGFLFGLLAASSSLFLCLMDVCFNLIEGIYFQGGWDVCVEVLINAYSLGVGVFIIVVLWLKRADLCPGNHTSPAGV